MRVGVITIRLKMALHTGELYTFSRIFVQWHFVVQMCRRLRYNPYCIMPSARQDDKTFHWENNFKAEFLQRRLYRFWFNSLVRFNSTYDMFHTVFSLNQALFIRCLWRDFQFFDFAYIQWHFHFSEKNLSFSEILNFSNPQFLEFFGIKHV